MERSEFESLAPNSRQLYLSFRSISPRILTFPHRICRYQWKVVQAVSSLIAQPLGVWNEPLLCDLKGKALEPLEEQGVERFRYWEEPTNQRALKEHVDLGRSTAKFTMLIPTETDPNTLAKLAECEVDFSDYGYHINRTASFVRELMWVVVPLWEDNEYALVVFADHLRSEADALERKLICDGEPVFQVSQRDGHFIWNGPCG